MIWLELNELGTPRVGSKMTKFNVTPTTLKKKRATATKKPHKKNGKEKDQDSNSKNWKDHEVETTISLHGKMEPIFLKNSKEERHDLVLHILNFWKKNITKITFQIFPISPSKGLGLGPLH